MRISIAVLALALAPLSSPAAPQHADAELRQWADSALQGAIDTHQASGIAVAIVRDGNVVYARGYGHADAEAKIGVEPGATLFSIGSISKSFSATAVAQLLERGAIRSLDDPANRYLRRIKLPAKNGREVTVRNLITHRGGIDESLFDLATLQAVPVPIAPQEVLRRLPAIVRTPGEISVYSNIGYGVVGILIEDVSGLTYQEYLRRNVFAPLGMAKSFVRYSPQEPIAQPMEYGANGTAEPIPQTWAYHPFISSSASVVSTADDMAKFALGHLNAELGAAPGLMSAATARLMHDRGIANAPHVAGFGMSFIANAWNGTRVTENAGSGPGFQALFILLPDLRTGFVALIMGGGPGSLKMFALREAFLNFYLGPLEPVPGPGAGAPMRRYAGIYRSERRTHATSEALFSPGTTLDVRADGPDTLDINGERGYREVAAGTFWKAGVAPYVPDDASSDMYVFVTGSDGAVRYVAPYLAVDVYKPALLKPMTAGVLSLTLCVLCGTGLLAIWWPRACGAPRGVAVALALCALAVPIDLAVALRVYQNPIFMIGFGHVLPLQIAAAFANAAAVLVVILACLVIRRRWRTRAGIRAAGFAPWHAAALCVFGVGLIAAFAHYNLIGYHVP
jgi:CubicO group peptidase (beta-lactamase class C family)